MEEKEEKDKRGDEEPRGHVAKIARLHRGSWAKGSKPRGLEGLGYGETGTGGEALKEPHLCRRHYGC